MKNILNPSWLSLFCAVITSLGILHAQPPSVSSLSARDGSPGKNITLTGSGFHPTAGNNIVYFGAAKAVVNGASSTQLSVTVPTGATSKPITVLNSSTGLSSATKLPFTVTCAPYTGSDFAASSFTAATAYNQGILFRGIVSADFDGDGKADVCGFSSSATPVIISVLRNTSAVSTVSFAARQDFALPTGATGRLLSTGDIDNDGKIDIIIGSTSTTAKGLYIFRNTSTSPGVISFSRVDFAADNNIVSVATGDLDGDGKPEVVASNGSGGVVSVYKNTSVPGSLMLTKTNFSANAAGGGVAIGDIDGDNKAEILVADQSGQYLSLFRNTITNGTIDANSFAAKVDFDLGSASFHYTVTLSDLDGDGKLDVVVSQGGIANVSVFRNTSTPGVINASTLSSRVDLPLSATSFGADVADMDGDGKPDIVAAASSKIAVIRNKATAGTLSTSSFASAVEFTADAGSGSSPNAITIADLNADGRQDLIPSIPTSTFTMAVLRGTIGYTLPLHFLSLKAYVKQSGVQIEWAVSGEESTEHYEVERSQNGQRFLSLGTKDANANVGGNSTYHFLDAAPLSTSSYYRIRIVGKSGQVSYSSVVKLQAAGERADIAVYPNPVATQNIALQLRSLERGKYLLTVFTAAGQPVLHKVIDHAGGSAVETIGLPESLTKGVYQLRLSNQHSTKTSQFIKE